MISIQKGLFLLLFRPYIAYS